MHDTLSSGVHRAQQQGGTDDIRNVRSKVDEACLDVGVTDAAESHVYQYVQCCALVHPEMHTVYVAQILCIYMLAICMGSDVDAEDR